MSEGEAIIRIYETSNKQIVHNLETGLVISISRLYKKICEEDVNLLSNTNIHKVYKSCGILGIINLSLCNYIISISESRKVGNIGKSEIFIVTDVEFIQIDHNKLDGKSINNFDYIFYEINQLIAGMRRILMEGVYFSMNLDLTNSLQTQKNIKLANNNTYDIMRNSNQNYLLNEQLLKPFFDYNIYTTEILVSAIYGYVNCIKENIKNIDLNYVLISRKDVNNLDLKLFCLGFDSNGFVSNKVETEQIIQFSNNIVFSFVQIRTPPLIKSEYSSKIFQACSEGKSREKLSFSENLGLFSYYLNDLNKSFRFIYFMNLLNKNNIDENIINEILENNIQKTTNKHFKYTYYNFDAKSNEDTTLKKNIDDDNVDLLGLSGNSQANIGKDRDFIETFLASIQNVFSIFKYFAIINTDSKTNKSIIVDQLGIINLFCQDGLERSNVIQMRIAWLVLENQLKSISIDPLGFLGVDILSVKKYEKLELSSELFLNNPNRQGIEFIFKFKQLWKENSQALTLHYTGIQKLNNGNSNLFNGSKALKGSSNITSNKLVIDLDEYLRQSCLDILLTKTQVKLHKIHDSDVLKCLEDNFKEYSYTRNVLAFIGTYNIGGRDFKENIDLLEWLLPEESKELEKVPDIYVIGLQEIVELNASNILISSNSPSVDYWKANLQANLDAVGKYKLVKCLDLVGVLMIIFIKSEVIDTVKNFDFLIQKTGMLGTMGNKGSCLMRFEIDDVSIAFSSGHLSAGQSSNSSRINELNDIINKNFLLQKSKKFIDHDIFFLSGDMNFRLDLDCDSVKRMIENKQLDTLIVYDQFIKARNINYNLNILDEGNINFNPTYKYNFDSNDYDTKAKRIPSWCDRIFFKKSNLIKQICYNRAECVYSDHKPVYSIFDLTVYKEIKEDKQKLISYFKRAMTFSLLIKKKIPYIKNNQNKNQNFYNYRKTEINERNVYYQKQEEIQMKATIPPIPKCLNKTEVMDKNINYDLLSLNTETNTQTKENQANNKNLLSKNFKDAFFQDNSQSGECGVNIKKYNNYDNIPADGYKKNTNFDFLQIENLNIKQNHGLTISDKNKSTNDLILLDFLEDENKSKKSKEINQDLDFPSFVKPHVNKDPLNIVTGEVIQNGNKQAANGYNESQKFKEDEILSFFK